MYPEIRNHFVLRVVRFSWMALFAIIPACSDQEPPDQTESDADSSESGVDLSLALFEPNHLVEVEIEMDPHDWDTIRTQGRNLTDVMTGCPKDFEYTEKIATVTVDGEAFENVAIRSKGFLGSLSRARPSLKLNFQRHQEGRTAWGMKRLTLNNDKQDSSHTHQCMAYQLFRDAGGIAPRCNLAHVTVNGSDLGIYSNVESIKKPFLARHFDDDDGNLYEGQGADFRPNMVGNFELKTNEKENDRSDLDKVAEAMEVDDDALFESLDQVVDMDAFLTHWSMEVVTGHWDSYSGNQNNFYIYHDPTSDKFYFIPWGADGAFSVDHSFLPPDIPASVYAWSWPTYRLYGNPDARARYHKRLTELLEENWDEESLLAEVDRIGELTSAPEVSLESQREFISNRKQMILDEIEGEAPVWSYQPKENTQGSACLPTFNISGKFDTRWGDLNSILPSEQSSFTIEKTPNKEIAPELENLDFHIEEISQPFSSVLVSSGPQTESNQNVAPGSPNIWIVGVPEAGGTTVVVVALVFEPSGFGEQEQTFYALETYGAVVRSTGSNADNVILGLIGDGKVTFDEVGTNQGDAIKGSFEGVFIPMVFDQFDR